MKKFILMFVSCYLVFSSMHRVMSLKCRTGNQQSDDQFQKIMQICRRRFLGYDRENSRDFNARDTDSQESSDSDSDEDMFDNKFLTSAGSRYNNNNGKNGDKMGSGSSSRYDYAGSRNNSTRQSSSGRNTSNRSSNGNNRSYYDNGQANSNRRSMRNSGMNSRSGYGENNYSNNRYNTNNNNNNMNNRNNMNGNNDGNYNNDGNNEREQACVTQCFFNELNLVDQRGFPERSAVIGIMTQNIQDPELRDFVEESVIECYHYINNNNNNGRQEKCQFSQNLLSCLAEKGSERCEDWDDE